MTISVKRLVRTHGALPAAVTALWVTVAVIALQLAEALIGWVAVLPYIVGGYHPFLPQVGVVALVAVPFGLGYFLCLWLVAPIAGELRVGHVITRAVLATGIGSTLVFVLFAVLGVVGAFSFGGALFGTAFPFPGFDGSLAVNGLAQALQRGLLTLVGLLPLGALGGVLLWGWRKDHPPRHPLGGIIDDV